MNRHAFRYSFRQSIHSLARNPWLAIITSGLIAISLVILGGFLLITLNVNQFIGDVESNVEISVFLYDGVEMSEVEEKIGQIENVTSTRAVSKEEGLRDFARDLGDPMLLRDLEGEENPLPDLIRVQVDDAENAAMVGEIISGYREVELVDYGEELVSRLMEITKGLNRLFLVLGISIALGAVFLIMNIIRLSTIARQDEVTVMKYMGASNGFIRFPFLMEGMVMGWVGTMVALMLLGGIYYQLIFSFGQDSLILLFQPVTDIERLGPIFIGLLIIGTLMSGFGSFVSIRKYLRV